MTLTFAVVAACGPKPSVPATPPSQFPPAPIVVTRTAAGTSHFDPAEHRADDVREEAERIIREIPSPTEAAPTSRDTGIAPTDTTWINIDGYRVQVLLSTTRERAQTAAELARLRFPADSVYIIFQAPYHKVRVGDFRTWQEVTAKVEEAKNKGYPDAFPVPGTVRVIKRSEDRAPE